jgi:hypothetical protein
LAFIGEFRLLQWRRSLGLILRFEPFSWQRFQCVFQRAVRISRLVTLRRSR